jgi:hypothetical protein
VTKKYLFIKNVPKRTVNTRNKKAEAIETTQNVEPDPVPAPEPVPEPTNTKSTKESPKSKNLAKVTPPVVRKTRRSARFAEIVPDPPPKEDIESAVDGKNDFYFTSIANVSILSSYRNRRK